ncbi:MAG: hypothetical protein V2A34_04450, partial [Lentisphaerota bacterium]
ARFIKLICTRRGTGYGYSLYELIPKTAGEPWGLGEPGGFLHARSWSIRPPESTDWVAADPWASWSDIRQPACTAMAYRISFFIPESWEGKPVVAQVAGLKDRCDLLVNQQMAASSLVVGATGRIRLPLASHLKFGTTNLIEVYVQASTAGEGRLGGVTLYSDPREIREGLDKIRLRDPKAYYDLLAHMEPEGWFPAYWSGRQRFWTIAGLEDDDRESLLAEDGSLEPYKCFSITPFLFINSNLLTSTSAALSASLEEGWMPIPSATWNNLPVTLRVTALAAGVPGSSYVLFQYHLVNASSELQQGRLSLALRPFEINPPWQWGGLTRISDLSLQADGIHANEYTVIPCGPSEFGATTAARGDILYDLYRGVLPDQTSLHDPEGLASGAIGFPLELNPGASTNFYLAIPLYPNAPHVVPPEILSDPEAGFVRLLEKSRTEWTARLERLPIHVPDREIMDTLRAAVAHVMINRDGPAIQAGSRAYEASWMRDGVITSAALLRMGFIREPREFILWYSQYLMEDGRVPAIVIHSRNEINPVHEYDSQGEFIAAIANYARFTRDFSVASNLWPQTLRAMDYLEKLRAGVLKEKDIQQEEDLRYAGLLPKSVSHEGYYPEPGNHSYWDDFWALKGWADAAFLAEALGHTGELDRIRLEQSELGPAVTRSIQRAMSRYHIDFIPGCAELGDFDPTSTAIALTACGQAGLLPPEALRASFDKYWSDVMKRKEPGWRGSYSPYELRNIHAFQLLGQSDRAFELMNFLLGVRRPEGWRQWPEAVYEPPRQGSYIGDMPHTWAACGLVESLRAMLLDEQDDRLIIGTGIPMAWIQSPNTVIITNAPTYWGELSCTIQEREGIMEVSLSGTARPPKGFEIRRPFDAPDHLVLKINGHTYANNNVFLSTISE